MSLNLGVNVGPTTPATTQATPSSVAKPRCVTCTHGERLMTEGGAIEGIECHLMPRSELWPVMQEQEWCSQHETFKGAQEKRIDKNNR